MAAFYDKSAKARPSFEIFCPGIVLSRDDAYATTVSRDGPALCGTSNEAAGTTAPLWRVSLIPDATSPESRFALVVSANLSLLDGHGFYKPHNMLSGEARVEALSPVRKPKLPEAMLKAMEGEPSLMVACPQGFLANKSPVRSVTRSFREPRHLAFT